MPEGPATAKTIAQLSITTVTTQLRATKLETISESQKRQRTGPTRPLTSILRCHGRIFTSTTAYNIIIQQQQSIIIHFPHENNINTPCLPQNTPKTGFPTLHDTIPAPKRGAPLSTTSPTPQLTSLDSKNAAGPKWKVKKWQGNTYIYIYPAASAIAAPPNRLPRVTPPACHVSPCPINRVSFPEFSPIFNFYFPGPFQVEI